MTVRLLAALLTASFAAHTAAAGAATVRTGRVPLNPHVERTLGGPSLYVAFVAGRGEANRITLRRLGRDRVLVHDSGAPVRTAGRCASRTLRSAVCPLGRFVRVIRVRLADRADRLTVGPGVGVAVRATGGRGDDRLTGGRGGDDLLAGPGDDRVDGGAGFDHIAGASGRDRLGGGLGRDLILDGGGADRVSGGPGDDRLWTDESGTLAADRFDGGAGRDEISYKARSRAVTATLGGIGGAAGERDELLRAERLTGSRAGDRLTGDDGPNRLSGGGGDDRYDARGGDDVIEDSLEPGAAGDITCGEGDDLVDVGRDGRELLQPDCEWAQAFAQGPRARAQLRDVTATSVTVDQSCAPAGARSRLVQLVTPPAGIFWSTKEPFGAVLGEGTRAVGRAGSTCSTVIALSEAGRSALRARGPGPVTVRSAGRTGVTWSTYLTPAG